MFVVGEGCRFAGGAHGDDGVGAFGDVSVDEVFQGVPIDGAVFEHGRNQSHDGTMKHIVLHWICRSMVWRLPVQNQARLCQNAPGNVVAERDDASLLSAL